MRVCACLYVRVRVRGDACAHVYEFHTLLSQQQFRPQQLCRGQYRRPFCRQQLPHASFSHELAAIFAQYSHLGFATLCLAAFLPGACADTSVSISEKYTLPSPVLSLRTVTLATSMPFHPTPVTSPTSPPPPTPKQPINSESSCICLSWTRCPARTRCGTKGGSSQSVHVPNKMFGQDSGSN